MKNKNVAALLCFFLGGFGVHEFYLGNTGRGVMFIIMSIIFTVTGGFMLIALGIALFIQTIIYLTMDQAKFDAKYNAGAISTARPETPRYQQQENHYYSQPQINIPTTPAKPKRSMSEILTEYKTMLDQGLITQEEYDAKKQSLLKDLH